MKRSNIYVSTIAADAAQIATEYGFGLEIAEYCTAQNMDENFYAVHPKVLAETQNVPLRFLHAPFSELFPCAVDPRARELAASRYRQAIGLAKRYGATKLIVHGGYDPHLYYPSWYVSESVRFWRRFLTENGEISIVLENVLEETPQLLSEIVRTVNDPRLRLCLDVGHINAYSDVDVFGWLEACAPMIGHFHVHNNDGTGDRHEALFAGSIPMREFLLRAQALCPNATYTLEVTQADTSVRWLLENRLL